MTTKKQKLQALDESILLQEVMVLLHGYKYGNRSETYAEYVAEDIIKLVRESYKPTHLVQSDKNKQYKEDPCSNCGKPKNGIVAGVLDGDERHQSMCQSCTREVFDDERDTKPKDGWGVEPLIEVLEKTIEFNTDSVIGEDGTIVVDYAQLRDALFGAMNTYASQAKQRGRDEERVRVVKWIKKTLITGSNYDDTIANDVIKELTKKQETDK